MKKTPFVALNLLILSSLLNSACSSVDEQVETLPAEPPVDQSQNSPRTVETSESEPTAPSASVYKDGTYVGIGEYNSPAGAETLAVTMVLKDDKVDSVSIYPESENETSHRFQKNFAGDVINLVSGKAIDEIEDLGAVNGSSLTPKGFNDALAQIKAEAKN